MTHVLDSPVRCGLAPILHGKFPEDDRAAAFRDVAIIADQGGFEAIWVEDHTRLPIEEIRAAGGVSGVDEPLDAWAVLSFLGGITSKVKLGTEVSPLTIRHPAQLAKTVATLDLLTGGRVILGAGTGWHKIEFESIGLPFERRTERFAKMCEAIEVMRKLWSQPAVTHHGRFYRLDDALVAPKPAQPGGPPIWFGGFSDHLLSAVARYGDGWILGTNPDPAFIAERWGVLRRLAEDAGRDPAEIRVCVPVMAHISHDRERAQETIEQYIRRGDFGAWLGEFFGDNARRFGLWGTPDDALARLRPYLELGVRDFIFDLRPPEIMRESAELLASEVLPRLMA